MKNVVAQEHKKKAMDTNQVLTAINTYGTVIIKAFVFILGAYILRRLFRLPSIANVYAILLALMYAHISLLGPYVDARIVQLTRYIRPSYYYTPLHVTNAKQ